MFLNFLKRNTTSILVILTFLIVTIVFLSPVFFEKKTLFAGDIMQGVGGTHELVEYEKQTGKQSLWTNSLFSGMPSIMVHTRYPGNLMAHVANLVTLKLPRVADMIFLSMAGFFILLSVYGVRPVLAGAGAFAFAFSTYTIVSVEAGHFSKVTAMAFMPVVVAGVVLAYRRNIAWGCLFMAFGLALNLVTNHVQITFYTFLTILFFVISEAVYSFKKKEVRRFFIVSACLSVSALVAAGTHAGYLLSVAEYGKYSIRGKSELKPKEAEQVSEGLDKDYAFDWSYTPAETMTLLIPRFYGGSSNENVGKNSETYKTLTSKGVPASSATDFTKSLPTYWGELPFTSGPLYIGSIIVFLFVLGLLIIDGRTKYWLLGVTVFSLFLTWGKNFEAFNYFLFDHVPMFNKFRAVMMAIVIAQLSMPVLALVTLEKILKSGSDKALLKRKLFLALGLTAGICAVIFILAGSFDFSSPGDPKMLENFKNMTGDAGFAQQIMDSILSDREGLMRGDALRSLLYIILSGGLIYLFIINKIKETIVVAGITLLVFFDLWTLDKNYVNSSNFQKRVNDTYFGLTLADESIKKDTALNYRVLNIAGNPFVENKTSYHHHSVGGNNPAKLRRYQDLIERHLSKNNEKVLNMLNAKYAIISPDQPPQLIPGALGNAWFVSEIKKVNSPDEEIEAIEKFEPAYTAVVDVSKFKITKDRFDTSMAAITLKEIRPDYLKYVSSSSAEKLAVFSEIYYPEGWVATIDGKPADMIRADYVLRAMYVPAGTHVIEMKFDMPVYHTGNNISLVCSILLLGGAAGLVIAEFRKRKNINEQPGTHNSRT